MTESLFLLILLLPLFGAFASYLAPRCISGFVATSSVAVAFGLSLYLTQGIFAQSISSIDLSLFEWFQIGLYRLNFSFSLDSLSAIFLLVITGVGSLIHLYSIGYMKEDPTKNRFFAYLNLFIFFMLLLILADNLLVMFIGWEGVGLCSYLLIGYWYKDLSFAAAGKKAFIINRIGDAGLLLAIFALFSVTNSLNFADIASWLQASFMPSSNALLLLAAIGIFVGVAGKSAQLPLFVWLPDAMAGPTPVSALIHAATMVTAGIYLLARFEPLYAIFPQVQYVIFIIALSTSLIAAFIALYQTDLKKVLAYSTVSQLGLMVMACSAGAYWVAIFHVVTHAFFKAGLFLAAGNVINACHHKQEMSCYGGLIKRMPFTAISFAVCAISISGIFPLAGYFSKHEIELAVAGVNDFSAYVWLFKLAAILTAVYMTRAFVLTFLGSPKSKYAKDAKNNSMIMELPVVLLALLAIVGGFLFQAPIQELVSGVAGEAHLSVSAGLLHSLKSILSVLFALLFYIVFAQTALFQNKLFKLLTWLPRNKFFLDEIYKALIVIPLKKLASFLQAVIEEFSLNNTLSSSASLAAISGFCLQKAQSVQKTRGYLYTLILSIILLLGICTAL